MADKAKKRATAKAIDFSGVKDRGNFNTKRVPEGDYAARIVSVEDAKSNKDGTDQYVFTIKLEKYSQLAYPYYCKLQENQLWKLRNIGVAAGLNVPKKRMQFDPNKLVGKVIGVTMTDEEFEGKEKSVIDSVFPASELADSSYEEGAEVDDTADDEEDTPTPVVAGDDVEDIEVEEKPKKKKGKKKKAA